MREPVTVISFRSAGDFGGLFACVTATMVLGCVEFVVACGCAAEASEAFELAAVAPIAGAAVAASANTPVRSAVAPSSFQFVMQISSLVHGVKDVEFPIFYTVSIASAA